LLKSEVVPHSIIQALGSELILVSWQSAQNYNTETIQDAILLYCHICRLHFSQSSFSFSLQYPWKNSSHSWLAKVSGL